MNGNCHFIFGTALGTAAAINLDVINRYFPNITMTPETATLFVLGGIVGGLFPDIDSPTSYIGKLSYPVSKWIGKLSRKFGKEKENHRGMLHDPTFYLAGIVLSYLFFPPLVGLFLGCLSHLFLDMFNPAGISLFLGASRLSIAKIKSGSKVSVFFSWGTTLFTLVSGILIKTAYIKL